MKKNQLRINRITILFSLTALLLFPFIGNAQLKVASTSGNVGVGITAPTTKLHLYATDGIGAGMWVQKIEDGSSDGALKIGTGTSGNGAIQSYRRSTGAVDKLILNSAGGNVGIGITAPTTKLHLYATDGIGAGMWIQKIEDGSSDGALKIGTGTSGNGAIQSYRISTGAVDKLILNSAGGNVGIGTTNPVYKLDVGGNLNINGVGTCNGGAWSSDQQFKTNIDSISNALSLIDQLKPRSFYFDTTNVYGLNFSNLKQFGLIAQDVEQLLPELVTSITKPADADTLGNIVHPAVTYKSLNYNAFIGIMLQGIKEQSIKIDSLSEGLLNEKTKTNNQDSIINSLQNQLNTLASMIYSCCEDNHDNGNHNGHHKADNNKTNVELNDSQTIVLEQNVPNPFAEQTSINYALPENTVKAQMLFYNAQGKLIQSTELTQKGKGTLNVFASDLSSGIYTYTLVVDGKIIETRKMVKQ